MTCVRYVLRTVLVGLLVGLPAAAGAGQPAFRADGMVALAGGALLVWAADGRLQVGSPNTGWNPLVRLPMTYVTHVVPDGDGALVGGSKLPSGGREYAVAVAVDSQGSVRTRWHGGDGLFNSVTSSQGKRWAVALDELMELLPDGRVQSVETVASLSELLIGPEGQWVFCKPANLTLAQGAPAGCSSSGPVAWRVTGSWNRKPLACGEWLVTKEDSELRVLSLSNGREVARRASRAETLACGRSGELLAAGRQIRVLLLPSLEVLAETPCVRGSVAAVVATPEGGACLDVSGRVRRFKSKDVPQR